MIYRKVNLVVQPHTWNRYIVLQIKVMMLRYLHQTSHHTIV